MDPRYAARRRKDSNTEYSANWNAPVCEIGSACPFFQSAPLRFFAFAVQIDWLG